MKYFLIGCFILCTCVSYACLNESHVNKAGKYTVDAFNLSESGYHKSHNKAELQLYLKNLYAKENETSEDIFDNKNNIAVTLIKLGRLDEAEKILLELKKGAPENYYVTVNLGTLYELQGRNKEALQFIKKALTIDPQSHGGSEWFHVKVLEFKLKEIPEADFPNQNILDLAHPKGTNIEYDISYQLQERIPFTPAPNLIMAKILQEFADYLADSISIKAAYLFYEIGMDYDRGNVLKLAEKRDALKPYFKKYKETIPVTGNYYLDGITQAADDNKVEIATSILEKGFNILKEGEEKKKKESRENQVLVFSGIGLCALVAGVFFYRRKKQSV